MRKALLIIVGATLAVGAIAVVSLLTGNSTKKSPSSDSSALVGRQVKSFSLPGLDGGTVRAPWASGHASVLVFFASYCVPCRGEMPVLAKYVRTHSPSPVVVLAVDALDERQSARSMVKGDYVTFPVAFDPNGTVTSGVFGFGQIPETVFVNAQGVVERVFYGAIPPRLFATGVRMLKGA